MSTRSAATFTVTAKVDTRRLTADVRRAVQAAQRSAGRINVNIGGGAGGARGGAHAAGALGSGLSAATANANEFTKALNASHARVLAFGASAGVVYGVARAMSEVVKSTIDVEKSLKDINVILGETTSGMEKMGHKLFQIAGQTGQTFRTVATAMTELSRQGLGTEQSLRRVKDAMILVRLTGMDAKSAVESLTAAINGFNEAGLNSTAVVNRMANVDAAFAVSSADLAEALKRAGSTAKEAGVSFNQLIAIVTAAQQNTARGGAVIGNAFKSIFTKIQRPRTLEMLEQIGIKTTKQGGQMKSTIQILDALSKKYDTLAHAQKSQITQLMGGLYQVNILKAAIRDLSGNYSIYNNALKVANQTTDQAIRRNEDLNKTLAALINETVQNFKEFAAAIGKSAVGPAIEGLFKGVNTIFKWFSSLDADSGIGKTLAGLFEGIGKALSGPGIAVGMALVTKLMGQFFGFLKTSVSSMLGLNSQAATQAKLQEQIHARLADNPRLIADMVSKGMNYAQVQNQILRGLREELVIRAQISKQVANLAAAGASAHVLAGVSRSASMRSSMPGATRSEGHIPNFNIRGAISEGIGAAMGGYKAGPVKTMSMPGLGKVTYNGAERVRHVPGFSQPFISPPRNSQAGRQHRKSSISQVGIDPYVPNFSPLPFASIRTTIPSHIGYGMSRKEQAEAMKSVANWAKTANPNDLIKIGKGVDGAFYGLEGLPFGIKAFHTKSLGSRSGTGPGTEFEMHGAGRNRGSILAGMLRGQKAAPHVGKEFRPGFQEGKHGKNYLEQAMIGGLGSLPPSVRDQVKRLMVRGGDVPTGIFSGSRYPVTPSLGLLPQAGIIKPMIQGVTVKDSHRKAMQHIMETGGNPLIAHSIGKRVYNWMERWPSKFMETKAMTGGAGLKTPFMPHDLHYENIMISNKGVKLAADYYRRTGGVPDRGQSLFQHDTDLLKMMAEGGHMHVVDPGHFMKMPMNANPAEYFKRIHPDKVGMDDFLKASNTAKMRSILNSMKKGEAPSQFGPLFGLNSYKGTNVTKTSGELTGIPGFAIPEGPLRWMVERYLLLKHKSQVAGASKIQPNLLMGRPSQRLEREKELLLIKINQAKQTGKGLAGTGRKLPELHEAVKIGDMVSIREWLVPTAQQRVRTVGGGTRNRGSWEESRAKSVSASTPFLPPIPKNAPAKIGLPPLPKPQTGKGDLLSISNLNKQSHDLGFLGTKMTPLEASLGADLNTLGIAKAVQQKGINAFTKVGGESAFGRVYKIEGTDYVVKIPRDWTGMAGKKYKELGIPDLGSKAGRWGFQSSELMQRVDKEILMNEVMRYTGNLGRSQTGILGALHKQKGKFTPQRLSSGVAYEEAWRLAAFDKLAVGGHKALGKGISQEGPMGGPHGGFIAPEGEAVLAQALAEVGAPIPGLPVGMNPYLPLSGATIKKSMDPRGAFKDIKDTPRYLDYPFEARKAIKNAFRKAYQTSVHNIKKSTNVDLWDLHGGNAMWRDLDDVYAMVDRAIAKGGTGYGFDGASLEKKILDYSMKGEGQNRNFQVVDLGSIRSGPTEIISKTTSPFERHFRFKQELGKYNHRPWEDVRSQAGNIDIHMFAGGHIPSFSPMSNAIAGEKLGISMSGGGGSPRVGYDPRVGAGVYTSSQGSLSSAINQHLAAGQPRSTLGSTGMGLQKMASQGKSGGHVPSFFTGSGDMDMGMMMGMIAMGFMGMQPGQGAEHKKLMQEAFDKAKKATKEAQSVYDNQNRDNDKNNKARVKVLNKEAHNVRVAENAFKNFDKMVNDLKGSGAKGMPVGGALPATGAGHAMRAWINAGSTGAPLSWAEQQRANAAQKVADARRERDQARQQAKRQAKQERQRARHAAANLGAAQVAEGEAKGAMAPKDPFTGKALPKGMKGMGIRALAGMNRFAMPLAFGAPMIGSMIGANMQQGNRQQRANAAATGGAVSALGMAGMGAMIGGMTGSSGGPAGIAIGAAVGLAAGGAMALNSYFDKLYDRGPELQVSAEQANKALNDFNNGIGQFTMSLTNYQTALLDTSGNVSPSDLSARRADVMETLMSVPKSERSNIMSSMYDPKALQAEGAKAQRRLQRDAEVSQQRADIYKEYKGSRQSTMGAIIDDAWEPESFIPIIGAILGPAMARARFFRSDLANVESAAMGPEFWDKSGNEQRLLLSQKALIGSKEGREKLGGFSDKYMTTLDFSDQKKNQQMLDTLTGIFNAPALKGNIYGSAVQAGSIRDAFETMGGDRESLSVMNVGDITAMGQSLMDALRGAMEVDAFTKIQENLIKTQQKHALDLAKAHEELTDAMGESLQELKNEIESLKTLTSGRESIKSGRLANKRGLKTAEMGFQMQLLQPFLGSEQGLGLQSAVNMAGILSKDTTSRQALDSGYKQGILGILTGAAGKSSANLSRAYSSAIEGDENRKTELQMKAEKTRPETQAVASLVAMVDKQIQQGAKNGEQLKEFVEYQIDNNAQLAALKDNSALRNQILHGMNRESESFSVEMIKQVQATEQQVRLLEQNNRYSELMLQHTQMLQHLGGLEDFTKGTHSTIERIDNLAHAIESSRSSIEPTIQRGRSALGIAEFLKNDMGQKIPAALMGTAVAGRAMQMSRAAQEAETRLGVNVPEWMKDPTSEKTLDAASFQIQSSLKEVLPQKLEEVKNELVRLGVDIARENQMQTQQQMAGFVAAMKTVWPNGQGATNPGLIALGTSIKNGFTSAIGASLRQQGGLAQATMLRGNIFQHQQKASEAGFRADAARTKTLGNVRRLQGLIGVMGAGSPHMTQGGALPKQWPFGAVTEQTPMAMLEARQHRLLENLSEYMGRITNKGENIYANKRLDVALSDYVSNMSTLAREMDEDDKAGTAQYGAEIKAMEELQKLVFDLTQGGQSEGLSSEYDQQIKIMNEANTALRTETANLNTVLSQLTGAIGAAAGRINTQGAVGNYYGTGRTHGISYNTGYTAPPQYGPSISDIPTIQQMDRDTKWKTQPKFQQGGMIGARSGMAFTGRNIGDRKSNLVMAEDGEYMLNRNAVAAIGGGDIRRGQQILSTLNFGGAPRKMQEGGPSGGGWGQRLGGFVSSPIQSIQKLHGQGTDFLADVIIDAAPKVNKALLSLQDGARKVGDVLEGVGDNLEKDMLEHPEKYRDEDGNVKEWAKPFYEKMEQERRDYNEKFNENVRGGFGHYGAVNEANTLKEVAEALDKLEARRLEIDKQLVARPADRALNAERMAIGLAYQQGSGKRANLRAGESDKRRAQIEKEAKAAAAVAALRAEGMRNFLTGAQGDAWGMLAPKLKGKEMTGPMGEKISGGRLSMSQLAGSWEESASALDLQTEAADNAATKQEFYNETMSRASKILEIVNERNLSVTQATKALQNEFKATAARMKMERGEISGRGYRGTQSQYYQGKVNQGTYGFGDMRGTFLSQFARNSTDDWQDLKDMVESTAVTFRQGFSQAFREFASGTKSSKEAFADMANSILDNILNRALDFGSENFMSYMFGQKFSQGGLVKGFSRGGRVKGPGSETSDSVAGLLSPGEFVVKASSAKRLGYGFLENINNKASIGGSFAAVVRNRIDYDDPKRPKTFTYNADPMLSVVGQTDTNNPQNQKKFQREEAFYTHKHNEHQREKRNKEKMDQFEKQQKQRMKAAYINAAMTITSGYAKSVGNTTGLGRFLNSAGGKMAVGAGFGSLMGGTEGAIMGGIGGLTAHAVGKFEQKAKAQEMAKQRKMFDKRVYEVLSDPKHKTKLANFQRQQGLIGQTQTQLDAIEIPGEKQRLQSLLDHYKKVPAGEDPFSWQAPVEKTAGQKLKEGWKGFKSGVKGFPGKAWKHSLGSEGIFTKGFWGGDHKGEVPFFRRGGMIRGFAGGGMFGGAQSLGLSNFSRMTPIDQLMGQPNVPDAALSMATPAFSNLAAGGEKAFARGGSVYGGDSEAVRLSNGEFVLNKDTVRNIGTDAAEALNRGDMIGFYSALGGGRIRGYASGGLVGEGANAPSGGSGLGGGFDAMNDNLVALLGAVEKLHSLEEASQDAAKTPRDDGAKVQGGGATRNISNNISITVNVSKKGTSTEVSSESQDVDSRGTESEQRDDRKEKEDNKRMSLMMEAKIMEVIHREQRPGGTLSD
jgi:TP901 family phage tail tape measure protein